jgi:hypothetical protein
MGIKTGTTKVHWNYLLAIEADVSNIARYIEFHKSNFKVFSIELAHLLLAASSEVDVVAKLLSKRLAPSKKPKTIDDYKTIILSKYPDVRQVQVFIPRFGLELRPWSSWNKTQNPVWWRSYNQVKHQRDQYFHQASLQNCLNAVAGLFVITFYYYATIGKHDLSTDYGRKHAMVEMQPETTLFRFKEGWHPDYVYV